MKIVELKAQVRPATGKKGTKQCRNSGLLPGILYGEAGATTPLATNPKELDRVLHTHAGANVVINLMVEGLSADPVTVVVKEVQIDSIKDTMKHVDFCRISLDKKIRAHVPFKIIGDAPGVKQGGILERLLWELEIESLPMQIPDYIEIDVSALNIGDSLTVSSITAPEGVTVVTPSDVGVVAVAVPKAEVTAEAAPAAEAEAAEPEVISVKGEKAEKGSEEKEETKGAEEKKKPEEKRKSKE
ncbi:50S ribosomal protein L25 [Candidatus Poribacteria bacterium]|nr:50S ribosomal protein L25 [Candidatus Poribacteria bacterium]